MPGAACSNPKTSSLVDHVAQIDANPKFHFAIIAEVVIPVLKIALYVCRANEGVHYGVEHSQHGIACVVHDAASVLLDGFRNQVEVFAQLAMRRILVVTGKTRVPSDIGVEYRSQLARQSLDHRGTPNADLGTTVC
jgi:hypothetical protein